MMNILLMMAYFPTMPIKPLMVKSREIRRLPYTECSVRKKFLPSNPATSRFSNDPWGLVGITKTNEWLDFMFNSRKTNNNFEIPFKPVFYEALLMEYGEK